jgi:hypothetical protein
VFAWAGFLGSWLLVAGPLYQGAIELFEAGIDRYHWPMWLFGLLIVVMLGSSVLNTALRMNHDRRETSAAQPAEDSPL